MTILLQKDKKLYVYTLLHKVLTFLEVQKGGQQFVKHFIQM